MRRLAVKPQQLVLGDRRARRARHDRLRHPPAPDRLGGDVADRPRGLRRHPRPDLLALLRDRRPSCCSSCAWLVALARPQLRAGPARRPPHHQGERAPTARATSATACGCARCCATRRPASCTPSSTSGSSCCSRPRSSSRSTTSCPRSSKFLHGDVYQAYSATADIFGVVFVVGIVWAIGSPLRAAALPHPHQDQARGRGHPRHVPRDRPHRLPHRGAPASRTRARRRSSAWSLVGYPLGQLFEDRLGVRDVRRLAHDDVGRALRRVHRVPRDPADHEAAPHGHVADEHVPARQGPAEGRDEAAAEPDGDRARDVRRRRRSRTSPGSSSSTPTRARSAAGARRCAPRTPPASRSTPARSCSRSAR